MQDRHIFAIVVISLFLFATALIPASSLDTGELNPELNKMIVEIPVTIKLWGYNDTTDFIGHLNGLLPTNMIQESYYPFNDQFGQWTSNLFDTFYGLENSISYEFDVIADNDTTALIELADLASLDLSDVQSPVGSTNYSGKAIRYQFMETTIAGYNEIDRYTIHLLNMSSLQDPVYDNHWYQVGLNKQSLTLDQDMRNAGFVGEYGLFYDPTAIAPAYNHTGISDLDNIAQWNHILDDLVELVETAIVGSPNSNNFLKLEKYFHVARVLLFDDKGDTWGRKASSVINYLDFRSQVYDLLPFMNMEELDVLPRVATVSNLEFNLQNSEPLQALLTRYAGENPGEVVVNANFANEFKNIIRSLGYRDWPDGYYFAITTYVGDDLSFVKETDNGTQEYEIGEIGFSLDSLAEWYSLSVDEIDSREVLAEQLKLMGKTFSLPLLDSPLVSQLDSPMTTAGVSLNWDKEYSGLEKEQVARRFGLLFRYAVVEEIMKANDALRSSIFFWVNPSQFEKATALIEIGDQEWDNFNISGGTENFKEAYSLMLDGFDEIAYSRNFLVYGIILVIAVVLIIFYVRLLRSLSISKEELKERLI